MFCFESVSAAHEQLASQPVLICSPVATDREVVFFESANRTKGPDNVIKSVTGAEGDVRRAE